MRRAKRNPDRVLWAVHAVPRGNYKVKDGSLVSQFCINLPPDLTEKLNLGRADILMLHLTDDSCPAEYNDAENFVGVLKLVIFRDVSLPKAGGKR